MRHGFLVACAVAAAPAAVPPVAAATVTSLEPVADARLVQARLTARKQGRLKFRVPRLPGVVRRATLRLLPAGGGRAGLTVRAYARGRSFVVHSGPVTRERWLSVDVTRAVRRGRTVTFAFATRGPGRVRLYTRRAGRSRAPRLLVTTAPSRSSSVDPVIAAAGDIACDPRSQFLGAPRSCRDRQTADLLADADLTAVLTLGDNQYEKGELAAFRAVYDRSWGRFKALTRPAVGNHEYLTPRAAGYFDYFNGVRRPDGPAGHRAKGYYSFDVGTWHLIALNSVCDEVGGCHAGSPQEQWLRADLARHPARCTLAYWHHPRFSSGEQSSSTRFIPFWRALYEAGADVVLAGHAHDYERFAPLTPEGVPDPARGLRQFVVGTGGKYHYGFGQVEPHSEVRDSSTWGVLELTLRSDGYAWRFVPEAGGRFTDSGSSACHD